MRRDIFAWESLRVEKFVRRKNSRDGEISVRRKLVRVEKFTTGEMEKFARESFTWEKFVSEENLRE